jgi:hypothetical protein
MAGWVRALSYNLQAELRFQMVDKNNQQEAMYPFYLTTLVTLMHWLADWHNFSKSSDYDYED